MQSLPHSTTPYNVSLMDFIPLLILWFYSILGKTLITLNQTPKWGKKDEYPANRGFSLAWHLALTKSFAWLVGRINKPTTRQTSHANDFVNAKSHIDGRFRLYDFCLRLSCASSIRKDFRPSPRAQSSLATSTMCRTNVVVLTFTRRDLSWSHDAC